MTASSCTLPFELWRATTSRTRSGPYSPKSRGGAQRSSGLGVLVAFCELSEDEMLGEHAAASPLVECPGLACHLFGQQTPRRRGFEVASLSVEVHPPYVRDPAPPKCRVTGAKKRRDPPSTDARSECTLMLLLRAATLARPCRVACARRRTLLLSGHADERTSALGSSPVMCVRRVQSDHPAEEMSWTPRSVAARAAAGISASGASS